MLNTDLLTGSNSSILLLSILAMSLILTFYFFIGFIARIKKIRFLAASGKLANTLIFALLSTSVSFFLLGVSGYHALTFEEKIATVTITVKAEPEAEPKSTQNRKFNAELKYLDGTVKNFELYGDEIEIQANILKWKPWSNILGLRTSYRLDRVVGRYTKLEDEKTNKRSVFALSEEDNLDIASWRKEYDYFSYLLDVEHGSASFVSAKQNKTYQLVVTNDGLILR